MQPALEIALPRSTPWARYAFDQLLPLVGYPYRFVNGWQRPMLRVGYGDAAASEECDVWIPHSESDWAPEEVELVFDGGIPILSVGQPPSEAVRGRSFTFDIVRATFELLSRSEELGTADFRAHESLLYELGLNTVPVVNLYANRLQEAIETRLADGDESLSAAKPWNGEEFAVVLSHDLDHVFHYDVGLGVNYMQAAVTDSLSLRARAESVGRGGRHLLGSLRTVLTSDDAMNHFERYVSLEEDFGVRSTIFAGAVSDGELFVEQNGKTIPNPQYRLSTQVEFRNEQTTVGELLANLGNRGWEVGLHGSLTSYRDSTRLREEKKRLEAALGTPVESGRQHYLRFATPDTWQAQADAGLQYDMTVGYNDRLGHRAGIAAPFAPYNFCDERPIDVLELPLSLHDVVFITKEPLSVDSAVRRSKRLLERVRKVGGLATLSWHPVLVATQDWDRAFAVYQRLLDWLDKQSVLIGTAREIATVWERRLERLRQ